MILFLRLGNKSERAGTATIAIRVPHYLLIMFMRKEISMLHKTSITPKMVEHKFIKVTPKLSMLFKTLPAEDKTNLTPDNRHVNEYNYRLDIKSSLEALILER